MKVENKLEINTDELDFKMITLSQAGEPEHTHQAVISEKEGYGFTITDETEHTHFIINNEVQSSGTSPHIHEIPTVKEESFNYYLLKNKVNEDSSWVKGKVISIVAHEEFGKFDKEFSVETELGVIESIVSSNNYEEGIQVGDTVSIKVFQIGEQKLIDAIKKSVEEDFWQDNLSDNKNQKVKVEKPKNDPNVRRVYDAKKNTYIGSYNLRDKKQADTYKSMYGGAK